MTSGAPSATPPGLDRGERAPDMVLPLDGTPTRFYAHVGGRPAVLIHAGNASPDSVRGLVDGLLGGSTGRPTDGTGGSPDGPMDVADDDPMAPRSAASATQPTSATLPISRMSVHVVGPPGLAEHDLACPLLIDREGAAARALRTDGQPVAFLLDRNLRVQARLAAEAAAAPQLLALLDQLEAAEPEGRLVTRTTPVLMIPDVLDGATCAELLEVWAADNKATGVEESTDGGRAETGNLKLKRRRDHIVEDAALGQRLAETIGRRVMPELRRAFAYRATSFEGFKIGCYDESDRGFFSPHRDNLSPSTAHRAFALTLNLNDGYEGGELRFPEYGHDRFRPAKGGALVFSGSLLHEVLDVTAGRRFVLLSFLFAGQAKPT